MRIPRDGVTEGIDTLSGDETPTAVRMCVPSYQFASRVALTGALVAKMTRGCGCLRSIKFVPSFFFFLRVVAVVAQVPASC